MRLFGWYRLILTKVDSLNPNTVSVFSNTKRFIVIFFSTGHFRTFWTYTVGHNWFVLEKFWVQIEISEWKSHLDFFWVLNSVIFNLNCILYAFILSIIFFYATLNCSNVNKENKNLRLFQQIMDFHKNSLTFFNNNWDLNYRNDLKETFMFIHINFHLI